MASHLQGLNPEQERAVRTTKGALLVLAGAGTGKTRVVTSRMVQLLAEGVPASSICAVTFTNKAAREMRQRVAAMLPRGALKGMVISTFHSLGLRILREFGEHVGIPACATVVDASDQLAVLTDALREVGLSRTKIRPQDARFRISLWKSSGQDASAVLDDADGEIDSGLAMAWIRYDQELRRRRMLDFDDLVVRTLELLEQHEQVRSALQQRWSHLMVDEYQDTNGCQYRLVQNLCQSHGNLCVVGDDDQSIYGWRGAEVDRILRFSRDWSGARVVTLEQNYRSRAPILEAAGRLIACNLLRHQKILRPQQTGGAPVTLFVADDERGETDFVVGRVLQMHMQEKLPHEHFAVLFRANSQCRPLEQALRERQIPYRVVGTRSFFDRREVRDLLAYLRLARNPDDDQALLRVVNTPPRGIGKSSQDRMAECAAQDRSGLLAAYEAHAADLPNRAREGSQGLLTLLATVSEIARKSGPAQALEQLLEVTGYRHHLAQITDDPLELKTRLSAVDELVVMARELGRSQPGAGLEGLLDALALQEGGQDHRVDDQKGPGVTLMTMHAAKGLEFPVVFIVGLEEGILPHGNCLNDDEEEGDDLSAIEEERRLLYVGITRARERLYLSRVVSRRRFGHETPRMASRFLDEIGLEHLEVIKSGSEPAAEASSRKEWLAAIRSKLANEAT